MEWTMIEKIKKNIAHSSLSSLIKLINFLVINCNKALQIIGSQLENELS